ncbi:MAG: ferredoxin family protein [Phycisphaerae bacterium]|nr:ferredoxin family protein [Phycisphaerae bacterium]
MTNRTRKVLLCLARRCRATPAGVSARIAAALRRAGQDYEVTDDLCALAAPQDGALAPLATDGVTIVACHERAVRWLLSAGGAIGDDVRVLNMREMPVEAILDHLGVADPVAAAADSPAESPDSSNGDPGESLAWFPVIDYERCTDCRQCMGFCLFGVFAVRDGRVVVSEPDKCKPYCPACARVCPNEAIMFPKHADAPINGGQPADGESAPARVDVSQLASGDVHAALRRRSAAGARGAGPPCACDGLRKMQEALGIPDEVVADIERTVRGKDGPA